MMERILLAMHFILPVILKILTGWVIATSTGSGQAVLKGQILTTRGAPPPSPCILMVVLPSDTVGGQTDSTGKFFLEIPVIRPERIQIYISGLNIHPVSIALSVEPGDTMNVTWFVEPASFQLPPVEVGGRRAQQTLPQPAHRLRPRELLRLPTPILSPELALGLLPGVNTPSELSTQFSVRGGNYDENLIVLEGFWLERPQLVRTFLHEGLSLIHPYLISQMSFYLTQFPVRYGRKMSSLLKVDYIQPDSFTGGVELSLLGISGYVGFPWKKSPRIFSTGIAGIRYLNYRYLFGTLERQGVYLPASLDMQILWRIHGKKGWFFKGFFQYHENQLQFTPVEEQVRFGTFQQPLQLSAILAGGEEIRTRMGMVGMIIGGSPSMSPLDFQLRLQYTGRWERLRTDLLGFYWLGQIQNDPQAEEFGQILYALGAGEYHEWIRHTLVSRSPEGEFTISWHASDPQILSEVQAGTGIRFSELQDRREEWNRVDSAGFSLPFSQQPIPPLLFPVLRTSSLLLGEQWSFLNFALQFHRNFLLYAGLRQEWFINSGAVVWSPRIQIEWSPSDSVSWYFGTGLYSQSPFYREVFQPDRIIPDLRFPRAWQSSITMERRFRLLGKIPASWSHALYFRYLWNQILYTFSEAFVQYLGRNDGIAWVAGYETRLYAELLPGTPSWISISVMRAVEKFPEDSTWVSRPADERLRIAFFLLDEFPRQPRFKFTTTLIFGSGLPFSPPRETENWLRYRNRFRSSPYLRVDVGFRYVIQEREKYISGNPFLQRWKTIWVEVLVLNLLDRRNVSTYWWFRDQAGLYYAVPRRLTGRRLNVRLVLSW